MPVKDEEVPDSKICSQHRRWRRWHEREAPVKIAGKATKNGVKIKIVSSQFKTESSFIYPNSIWKKYPKDNKVKLLDNITYVFTCHLPFLLKGNVRLEYNTGYPQVFSWSNQSFMRHLPSYWYLFNGRRGRSVFPILKVLLNSNVYFSETKDFPPTFPETKDENVIIPFTFGKDSFLTYKVAKEIGLHPTLIWFNDPTDEGYEGVHKLKLFEQFSKEVKDKLYFLPNPLGNLREHGEAGWFGWELVLTSWTLLMLPFSYAKKAGYIVFSNEKSVNSFLYDRDGLRVMPDFEQTSQATEELSLLTQSLSEGEVYTTTFLQGLHDLGIIGILKQRYYDQTFKYLMSCWSDNEEGKDKRWCGCCTKCARLYIYLTANGINPIKEAGFKDNMLNNSKVHLYNVFGKRAAGGGWDAFGLNADEQCLAFYLAYLRGNRDPLMKKFIASDLFLDTKKRFKKLVAEYYGLHSDYNTPPQWKVRIHRIFRESLKSVRREIDGLVKDYKG